MIRLWITILFILLTGAWAFGQTCMTFQEMEENGLTMKKLDAIYPNAVRTDTTLGVFKNQKEFLDTLQQFYTNLFQYFKENSFIWGDTTYCFNKIYFGAKGQVEYWFFNFKKADNIPQEKQDRYLHYIREFSRANKIKITADTKFSQCTSVDFFDL